MLFTIITISIKYLITRLYPTTSTSIPEGELEYP